ncbi:TIGR03086 family metal-binding protein [Streptomyces sp. NBC_00344]|uniref:TIGR03086 family metal-binding protein n=1 Tax=Streptomyces sp. NBC_00344 TaxID=2975720 RepID=UPI002E1CCC89
MTTTTTDLRVLFERAAEQFAALLKTVPVARLDDPTPCGDYDVRALISHVVGATHRFAHIGEGGHFAEVPARMDGVPDDGWGTAYGSAMRRASAAWAVDERLDATVSVPWGDIPGRAAVGGYLMETVTHTWDLTRALAHPLPLDPELADAVLPLARQVLPAARRGGDVPFGPVVSVPEDADVYDRLAAWLGREV